MTCPIRHHFPAWSVCVCLLRRNVSQFVDGQCSETLLFLVDASLATLEPDSSLWRLPTLIYDLDPWTEILLVTSLTHTHTHTQTHIHTCPWPAVKNHFTIVVVLSLSCLEGFGQVVLLCCAALPKTVFQFDPVTRSCQEGLKMQS